jgi:Protein of unknown function (DUF1236)
MNRRQSTLRLDVAALALAAATGLAVAQEKVSQENVGRTNVLLSAEQRAQIRKAIIEARNAWRVSSVDFDLAVGSVVPRGPVQVVPVPDVLVQIKPEWRGLLYFVYDSEIVIVDPGDMRIVAIVPG